eukprot:1191128-Prorocentrum_minimum.AAC.1
MLQHKAHLYYSVITSVHQREDSDHDDCCSAVCATTRWATRKINFYYIINAFNETYAVVETCAVVSCPHVADNIREKRYNKTAPLCSDISNTLVCLCVLWCVDVKRNTYGGMTGRQTEKGAVYLTAHKLSHAAVTTHCQAFSSRVLPAR